MPIWIRLAVKAYRRSRTGAKAVAANNLFALLCCGIGLQAAPLTALGQREQAGHEERGSITLSALDIRPATSARLDTSGGRGTSIDLERDLDLERSVTAANLGGYYWFGRRGRVNVSYLSYSRSQTKQIDKTIEFGDRVFAVNSVIQTTADVAVLQASYTFAAVERERGFFGISGGLYTTSSQLRLNDSATGNNQSSDANLPLPVIGVRGRYQIGKRITLRGSSQWFGISTNKATGRLLSTNIGADYSFGDRIALGIAYNVTTTGIRAKNDRGLEGHLNWGYDAAALYVRLNFGK